MQWVGAYVGVGKGEGEGPTGWFGYQEGGNEWYWKVNTTEQASVAKVDWLNRQMDWKV